MSLIHYLNSQCSWFTYYMIIFAWVMGIILGWQVNDTYRRHFKKRKPRRV